MQTELSSEKVFKILFIIFYIGKHSGNNQYVTVQEIYDYMQLDVPIDARDITHEDIEAFFEQGSKNTPLVGKSRMAAKTGDVSEQTWGYMLMTGM